MKKVLLNLIALSSLGAMAQTYTAADSITVGDQVNYFVLDSNAANLDATTGAAVTWDYSGITGYPGAPTNLDENILASTSAFASDFPDAYYNDVMAGGTSIFYENYEDSVVAHGYVFVVDGNEVKIKHNIDIMKTLEFPMSQGDSFTDFIEGTIDVDGGTVSFTGEPQEGSVTVSADGTGSMNIGGTIIPDVIRIKLVETLTATVTIPPFPTQTGYVTRTLYSYYDHTNQKLPVFIHANIDVQATGFGGDFQAVYSTVDVTLGVEDNEVNAPTVYPNPASDFINFGSNNIEKIVLTDMSGKVVYTGENLGSFTKMDVSRFKRGTYVLTTVENGKEAIQKVVLK